MALLRERFSRLAVHLALAQLTVRSTRITGGETERVVRRANGKLFQARAPGD